MANFWVFFSSQMVILFVRNVRENRAVHMKGLQAEQQNTDQMSEILYNNLQILLVNVKQILL